MLGGGSLQIFVGVCIDKLRSVHKVRGGPEISDRPSDTDQQHMPGLHGEQWLKVTHQHVLGTQCQKSLGV